MAVPKFIRKDQLSESKIPWRVQELKEEATPLTRGMVVGMERGENPGNYLELGIAIA